jgi:hypothetical protein
LLLFVLWVLSLLVFSFALYFQRMCSRL